MLFEWKENFIRCYVLIYLATCPKEINGGYSSFSVRIKGDVFLHYIDKKA